VESNTLLADEAVSKVKLSGRRVLVVGFVILALLEAVLGWELPDIGQSLLLPVILVVVVGLVLTFVTSLVLEHRSDHGGLFMLGGVAITVLAIFWTLDAVLPLRVMTVQSQLDQLERCATGVASPASCPKPGHWTAPLLGPILNPTDFYGMPGEMVFPQGNYGSASSVPVLYGYFYEANPRLVTGQPECTRHLYGPWYEFGFFTGDCPFGFSLFINGAEPAPHGQMKVGVYPAASDGRRLIP